MPEKTGVYNNGRYEPIPEGYTVFERLEKFFGPDNIDTVAIIAKKSNVDHDPPYRGTSEEWTTLVSNRLKELKKTNPNAKIEPDPAVYQEGGRIVEKDGRQLVEIPGKPWYRATKHLDLWVNGLGENEKVAEGPSRNWKSARIIASSFSSTLLNLIIADISSKNSQEYADVLNWTTNIRA